MEVFILASGNFCSGVLSRAAAVWHLFKGQRTAGRTTSTSGNEVYPWGFDDLSPEQKARVDAANKIYIGLAKFVEYLIARNVFFAIENLENSLWWLLPIWSVVLQHAFFVTFDACVYGGQRKTSVGAKRVPQRVTLVNAGYAG